MKTTYLRNLLLAVVCLFAGTQAQAQFSGSAEQYPTANWSGAPVTFSLSEVATALETDAATLGTALTTYIEAETPDPLLFSAIVNGNEVAWTTETTAANNGFWMTATGQPVAYGDESVFYASPIVDTDADALTFNLGQMPNVMQAGQSAQATLKLTLAAKSVTFALTLNVVAKPVFEVPEPTVLESQLNILGTKEVVVEQYPRGGYDSDAVKLYIADALEALGLTEKSLVASNLDTLLYATQYNTGDVEQGGGMKKDSLTNKATAGGIGWWLRPVQDANGEETGECSATGWGDTDRFFLESFAYNAENDSLTCNLGQYPGQCKDNEQYFTYIYMIYGQKAYRFKYTLKLLEKEQGSGLSAYTKVGEANVELEQEPLTDWAAVQARPDVDAIAAALGCEVSALGLVALDDKDNFAAATANNGGWWLTEVGTAVAYANGAFYIEPATANDYSVLNVGHKPNTRQVGDELKASLYFTNGDKYYQYNVTLKIVEPEYVEKNFQSVETRTFAIQALPTANYSEVEFATVSLEDIEALIGTASPALYGLNIDSVAAVKGAYSNAWSCDPKPGFWLNAEGRVSVWGDANSTVAVGFKPSTGVFYHNQKPNAKAVGDVFTTQLFLVNEENNKMITFNITISYVESLEEKEEVGTENFLLPVDMDEQIIPIDLTKPAQALGVSVDDLLSPNNYYLRGMKKDGTYGEATSCSNGLSFDLDGGFDAYGLIYFTIEKQGDATELIIMSNDPVAEDFNVSAQFCFEVNNKQYVYYVKLLSKKGYEDGIETVSAEGRQSGKLFDLSGRQVVKPQRGLYIQQGRKFIVK